MSRLAQLPASLRTALTERRALKVIAGLTNFDAASVERISRAARSLVEQGYLLPEDAERIIAAARCTARTTAPRVTANPNRSANSVTILPNDKPNCLLK